MKKIISISLAVCMAATILAGCGGNTTPSTSTPSTSTPESSSSEVTAPEATLGEGQLKLGVSIMSSAGKSVDAEDGDNGTAQSNIDIVAVTVDENGVIESCAIDTIQSKIKFTPEGTIATELDTTFASKMVLGDDYGMRKASPIGKEWNEQAQAFADYAVGKTVADLRAVAVDEKGVATDADLAASVSLVLADFIDSIEDAVNNAVAMGTNKGDKLFLTSATHMKKSKDATPDKDGLAQAYATINVSTIDAEGKITACYLDSVQANVNFDLEGKITSDLDVAIKSKNELGEAYNMKGASAIGKEWNEQAKAFADFVVGKTVEEVSAIALTEAEAPADADLATSVTMGVGEFIATISMMK